MRLQRLESEKRMGNEEELAVTIANRLKLLSLPFLSFLGKNCEEK